MGGLTSFAAVIISLFSFIGECAAGSRCRYYRYSYSYGYRYCSYGCCGSTCCSYSSYANSNTWDIGRIIGTVIGGLFFVGAIVCVIICMYQGSKRRKAQRGTIVSVLPRQQQTVAVTTHQMRTGPAGGAHVNPAFQHQPPHGAYMNHAFQAPGPPGYAGPPPPYTGPPMNPAYPPPPPPPAMYSHLPPAPINTRRQHPGAPPEEKE